MSTAVPVGLTFAPIFEVFQEVPSEVCPYGCRTCFYCEAYLPTDGHTRFKRAGHEHDHFPYWRSDGCDTVVPSCINCHDLKDRVLFRSWDTGLQLSAVSNLCLVLGWQIEDLVDLEMCVEDLPGWDGCWADLSVHGRLLYAKLSHLLGKPQGKAATPLAQPVPEGVHRSGLTQSQVEAICGLMDHGYTQAAIHRRFKISRKNLSEVSAMRRRT